MFEIPGRRGTLVIAALLFVAATSCFTPPPPPPESVLEGTWKLTADQVDENLGDFLITFDENGTITRLTYIYNNLINIIGPAELVRTSSQVTASNVSISATWSPGSTLFFEGLINPMKTVISGEASFLIVISPSFTVSIPPGPAELTRQ